MLVLAGAPAVRAGEETEWRYGLEAVTDLPLDVAARFWVEGPFRLHLDTSMGWLPTAYVEAANAALVAADAFDQATADLVAGSLGSSMVWRTHFGWRPVDGCGFYFTAGYGLVVLGGTTTTIDAFIAVTHQERPPWNSAQYGTMSVLHMVDAELGWYWLLWEERISLRVALGFAGTVWSSTSVSPTAPSEITGEIAARLDEVYRTYLFLPVLSLAAGWNFAGGKREEHVHWQ